MYSLINRINNYLSDPARVLYMLRARLGPRGLLARYKALAQAAGVKQLYLVLSFDCDTEDDIPVVGKLHGRLLVMGVKPVYAVPGKLLERGKTVYRRIYEQGGEFINHGYNEHTYFDSRGGRYASCFFYHQLSRERVREDLTLGDACLKEFLGCAVRGCRVPHFGTFQRPSQLRFLYEVLAELGYGFSSSTLPVFGFRKGPIFPRQGVAEIPVSGMASSLLTILDTWSCFMAPGRNLSPSDYHREGFGAAAMFGELGVGVLNYYADPLHIHDKEIFFETVAGWLRVARPVTYSELLRSIRK